MPAARLLCDERPGEELEVTVLSTWRERLRGLLGTGPDAPPGSYGYANVKMAS